MAVKNYYIDDRVCVPGKSNKFLNLASWKWLNSIISQVIYGTTINMDPYGPLLIQNGLNAQPSTTNYIIELGGTLLHDTVIDASGFNFDITDIRTFNTTGTSLNMNFISDVTITGGSIRLDSGLNDMHIVTPLVTGATANPGDVLTLQTVGGRAEWAAPTGGGGLINVGLGLTEIPAGTVKLGGTGIGTAEDLSVALNELWSVSSPVTIPFADVKMGVGIEPLVGGALGGFLTAEVTSGSDFSLVGATTDGIESSAAMYQVRGTNIKQVTLGDLEINLENREPLLANGQITINAGGMRFRGEDLTLPNSTELDVNVGAGVRFHGELAGVPFSYEFPRNDGLIGQVLVNDGANKVSWQSPAAAGNITPVAPLVSPYVTAHNELVEVDASAGPFDIHLPLAPIAGAKIYIKKTDSFNPVLVSSLAGHLIDGAPIRPLDFQYESVTLIFNGNNDWWIV